MRKLRVLVHNLLVWGTTVEAENSLKWRRWAVGHVQSGVWGTTVEAENNLKLRR